MNNELIDQLIRMLKNLQDQYEQNPLVNDEGYFYFLSKSSIGYYFLARFYSKNHRLNEALESINLAIKYEQQINPTNPMIENTSTSTGAAQPGTITFKLKLLTLEISINSMMNNSTRLIGSVDSSLSEAIHPATYSQVPEPVINKQDFCDKVDQNRPLEQVEEHRNIESQQTLDTGVTFDELQKLGYSKACISRLNRVNSSLSSKADIIDFLKTHHNRMMFFFQTYENCVYVIMGRSNSFSLKRLMCIFEPDFLNLAQTNFFTPEHLAKMLYASGPLIFSSIKGFLYQINTLFPHLTLKAEQIYNLVYDGKPVGHRRLASMLLYAKEYPMLSAEELIVKTIKEEKKHLTLLQISTVLRNHQLLDNNNMIRKSRASLKTSTDEIQLMDMMPQLKNSISNNTATSFFKKTTGHKRKRMDDEPQEIRHDLCRDASKSTP